MYVELSRTYIGYQQADVTSVWWRAVHMLAMDRRAQLQEELVNNIVEGVDTVLAFFSTYHPDLAQCMKMSAESLITEQAELLKEARENGLTDQDIEEVESRALEDVLREHKGPKSDNEHWMDLVEAVRQFVTPNSYARFCEKVPVHPPNID